MKFNIITIRWHGCAYQEVQPSNADAGHTWWELQQRWQQQYAWCTESFGHAGDVWAPVASRWYRDHGRLLFRSPADITAFLLRWS